MDMSFENNHIQNLIFQSTARTDILKIKKVFSKKSIKSSMFRFGILAIGKKLQNSSRIQVSFGEKKGQRENHCPFENRVLQQDI